MLQTELIHKIAVNNEEHTTPYTLHYTTLFRTQNPMLCCKHHSPTPHTDYEDKVKKKKKKKKRQTIPPPPSTPPPPPPPPGVPLCRKAYHYFADKAEPTCDLRGDTWLSSVIWSIRGDRPIRGDWSVHGGWSVLDDWPIRGDIPSWEWFWRGSGSNLSCSFCCCCFLYCAHRWLLVIMLPSSSPILGLLCAFCLAS